MEITEKRIEIHQSFTYGLLSTHLNASRVVKKLALKHTRTLRVLNGLTEPDGAKSGRY